MRTAETTTHEITADDLDESLHIEDSKVDDVLEKPDAERWDSRQINSEVVNSEAGQKHEGPEDQHGKTQEQQFQFGSLAEVAESLGSAEGWEKVAVSTGGDILKRSVKEWVYKEEGGKETSVMRGGDTAERQGQILEDLYSQGFSVSEFQKPNSDVMAREIYFADEKGNISYEVYSLKTESEAIASPSEIFDFFNGDYNDSGLLPAQNFKIFEAENSLTAQSTAGNQETAKAESIAGETQARPSGIELRNFDNSYSNSDKTITTGAQTEVLTILDKNLSPVETLLSLEQSVDVTSAVETGDYDDETPGVEASRPDNIPKPAKTFAANPKPDFLAPPPNCQPMKFSQANKNRRN